MHEGAAVPCPGARLLLLALASCPGGHPTQTGRGDTQSVSPLAPATPPPSPPSPPPAAPAAGTPTLGTPTLEGQHPGQLTGAVFSADGALVALCHRTAVEGEPGGVQIWDARSGALLRTFRADLFTSTNRECHPAFRPDGAVLATHGLGRIGLWEVSSGLLFASTPFNGTDVSGMTWSPDGTFLVASLRQMNARYYDIEVDWIDPETLRVRRRLSLGHAASDTAFSWGEHGPALVILGWDENRAENNDTRVVDARTGRRQRLGDIEFSVCAALSRDRRVLFSLDLDVGGASTGEMRARDINTRAVLWSSPLPHPPRRARPGNGAVALSADGQWVAAVPDEADSLTIWNAIGGAVLASSRLDVSDRWRETLVDLAFSPDGSTVLVVTSGYIERRDDRAIWQSVVRRFDARTAASVRPPSPSPIR